MKITVHHRLPRADLGLGLVYIEGLTVGPAPEALAQELSRWIDHRSRQPLTAEEEACRKGSRDMLRNGVYKPTGRGKPASEYLIRAAAAETFPRINGPVDANNLVSLQYCAPISLWDVDLAQTAEFEFRLGQAEEHYVFNPAGQTLELQDLVCGSAIHGASVSRPVVTPIKDSLATKLRPETRRVAGAIYYPLAAGSPEHLAAMTKTFLRWLLACGQGLAGASGCCLFQQSLSLEID